MGRKPYWKKLLEEELLHFSERQTLRTFTRILGTWRILFEVQPPDITGDLQRLSGSRGPMSLKSWLSVGWEMTGLISHARTRNGLERNSLNKENKQDV